MGRPGIQISQEGVPIDRAADYQKVLDDRWPFLDIAFDQVIPVYQDTFPTPTHYWYIELLRHNLGYIPAFMARDMDGNLLSLDISSGTDRGFVVATDEAIYYASLHTGFTSTAPLKGRLSVRVFACDITREFRQPHDMPAPRPRQSAPRYGARVIKPTNQNGRINDTEMSGFSLHNNAKAFAIQQTGLRRAEAPDFDVVIDHNLGYPPVYFIAPYNDYAEIYTGSVVGAPVPEGKNFCFQLNDVVVEATTTTTEMHIFGAQAVLVGNYAFLIVKDPLEGVV